MSAIQQVLLASGGVAPWAPSDVASLKGWWVSDNPSNTLASGFLSVVADRSANANPLTPYLGGPGNEATLVPSVLNGRTIWRGDVTKQAAFVVTNDDSIGASGLTLAFLYRSGPAGGAADQSVIRYNINGANAARLMIGRGSYASNAVYAGGRRLDSDTYDGANDNTDYSTNWLILVVCADYAAGSVVMSVNGTTTTDATFQTPGSVSATPASNQNVGHSGGGSNNAFGDYAEGLVYTQALNTSNRQKLEGYLAWQWGLQASLVAGHPYISAPP